MGPRHPFYPILIQNTSCVNKRGLKNLKKKVKSKNRGKECGGPFRKVFLISLLGRVDNNMLYAT